MRDDFKIVDYDSMPVYPEGGNIPGIREKENGSATCRLGETFERENGRYHVEWSRVGQHGDTFHVELRRYLGGKLIDTQEAWLPSNGQADCRDPSQYGVRP